MRTFMKLIMVGAVLFVASTASAHKHDNCEHILRNGPRVFKVEEVTLYPANESTLTQAINSLEAVRLNGQGTAWLEGRYEKRRNELLTAVKSASFKKLYLAKPQVAEVVGSWAAALERLAEIDASYGSLTEVERKAFVQVYDAIRSALTSHALSWAKVSTRELEFPRIKLILDEIKDFDTEKPKYSLYRIRRAIETRHSLREYSECR